MNSIYPEVLIKETRIPVNIKQGKTFYCTNIELITNLRIKRNDVWYIFPFSKSLLVEEDSYDVMKFKLISRLHKKVYNHIYLGEAPKGSWGDNFFKEVVRADTNQESEEERLRILLKYKH
jgi:hypothetical protein